jgi:hypothetical protein
VPPGQEGKITLAVEHTEGYVGEVAKYATVTTNDPARPSFNLVLRAYFKSEQAAEQLPSPKVVSPAGGARPVPPAAVYTPAKQAGPFEISPSDKWVTSLIRGSTVTNVITLFNRQSRPVRIKKVLAGGANFAVNLQKIEEGKRYELDVATAPGLKPGHYSQTVKLLTDSKAAPEIIIELEATVFPTVFANPSALYLKPISLTADLSQLDYTIWIRKVRETGLEIKSVSSTLPFIKLDVIQEAAGQVYSIHLKFDKAKVAAPGPFSGTIRIETNDVDVPVIEIPISGSFS